MEFTVHGPPRVMSFLDEIVREMVDAFGIPHEEAIGRVNRQWHGRTFHDRSLILHELPKQWASDIYYGHDSYWWRVDAAKRRPLPFP